MMKFKWEAIRKMFTLTSSKKKYVFLISWAKKQQQQNKARDKNAGE